MYLKYIFFGLITILISNQILANPPFEVIQSCRDGKPVNKNITMYNIAGKSGGFVVPSDPKCAKGFKYEINYNKNSFGSLYCASDMSLIVAGRMLKVANAINFSVTPAVKPNWLEPGVSKWWKIDDKANVYLCISGPLSQTGKNAAYYQYYIIENAFDLNKVPKPYFYFFGYGNNVKE